MVRSHSSASSPRRRCASRRTPRRSRSCSRPPRCSLGAATWLDARAASAKEITLIATLAAAAAAGRVLLAPVPDVQPVTDIAVIAGVALGARAGIGVGATAAFVSNFFLGQGLWTPWQMLAWGACGGVGALLAPLLRRRIPLAIACCVLGFAFGFVLDVWNWYAFYPHTWAAFVARQASGVPVRRRARERQPRPRARRRPRAAAPARALPHAAAHGDRMGVKLALVAAATVLSFVQGRAQPDGGYAEPGGRSTAGLSASAVLALHAAGASVPDAARAYLQAHETGLTPTEVELATMAEAVTGGASPGILAALKGAPAADGPDRPCAQLDVLGRTRPRADGPERAARDAAGDRGCAAAGRGVRVGRRRGAGQRRHERGRRSARSGRRAREADRPRARLPARAPERRRRLRALAGRALERPVHRLGDPGVPRRRREAPAAPSASSSACAEPDGSLRYSAQYATTPLWVSTQALPALARRPFPLR